MEKLFLIIFFASMLSAFASLGGFRKDKLNSTKVKEYAKMATKYITSKENSKYHMKLLNITDAEMQVVAGKNYKLQFVIGTTECLTANTQNTEELENCILKPSSNTRQCTAFVWEQVWITENPVKVTKYQCEQIENDQ